MRKHDTLHISIEFSEAVDTEGRLSREDPDPAIERVEVNGYEVHPTDQPDPKIVHYMAKAWFDGTFQPRALLSLAFSQVPAHSERNTDDEKKV